MDGKTGVIRIVIADDHAIIRDGVRMLLDAEARFQVLGEASDGEAAVEAVARLRPDILLLDLSMPRMDGLDVLRALAARGLTVRTVMLTAVIDKAEIVMALELGARGVVLKEAATPLLYRCLDCVMAGEFWVGRESVGDLIRTMRHLGTLPSSEKPLHLSPRERLVVAAVAKGSGNREVAAQLHISEQTVKNHLQNIFDKVGVSSRVELALWAVEHGLSTRRPSSPGPAAPARAAK